MAEAACSQIIVKQGLRVLNKHKKIAGDIDIEANALHRHPSSLSRTGLGLFFLVPNWCSHQLFFHSVTRRDLAFFKLVQRKEAQFGLQRSSEGVA